MIYILEVSMQTYIYIVIGIIALLVIWLIILNKTKSKPHIKAVDQTLLDNLYLALGKKSNIKSIEIKQQRLQIEVEKVKDIDQDLLKHTNTPAFLTGKKITLLIKDNTKEVFNYLNEKRKEEE